MDIIKEAQKQLDSVNTVELGVNYDEALVLLAALSEGIEDMSLGRPTLVLHFSMTDEKVPSLVNVNIKVRRIRSFFYCVPHTEEMGAYVIDMDKEF